MNQEDENVRKDLINFIYGVFQGSHTVGAEYERDRYVAYLEKQGEQKPAWSEEDENGLGDALWAIQQARTIAKDENDMGNLWYAERWLKSLKDRYIPQPRQEWSEEDKKILERVINDIKSLKQQVYCKSVCDEEIDWLKSIKGRYTWKPSDEQMLVMEYIKNCFDFSKPSYREIFISVYKQLKAL